MAGIQEGVMSMLATISNGLTIISFIVSLLSFGVYLLTKVFNSVLPRLLGVFKLPHYISERHLIQ